MDNSKKKLSVWIVYFNCLAFLALISTPLASSLSTAHDSAPLPRESMGSDGFSIDGASQASSDYDSLPLLLQNDDTNGAHTSIDVLSPVAQLVPVSGSASSLSAENDSTHLPRIHRATTDTLGTYVDHLRAIARVTSGIFLTQNLINGTGKAKEITSELLQMGTATPAQIKGLNATGVQAAITELKNLPTSLNVQDEMRDVLKNAEAGLIIKKNNVTIVTDWPGMASFNSRLDGIANNGVNKVASDLFRTLGYFGVEFRDSKTQSSKKPLIAQLCKEMLTNFTLLNATIQFSSAGSAFQLYSPVSEIVRSMQGLSMIKQVDLQESGTQATLNKFFEMAAEFYKVVGDMRIVNEVVVTRYLPGTLRKLVYTSGLPQGRENFIKIHKDLKLKWMEDVVNSSTFGNSIVVLKQLDTPLANSDTKLGRIDELKANTFAKLMSAAEKFVLMSSKKTDLETALDGIAQCLTTTVGAFAGAQRMLNAVTKLDALFAKYRADIQAAIQIVRNEDINNKLNTLITEIEKTENSDKSLNQIFSASELQVYDSISNSLDTIKTLVTDNNIRTECTATAGITSQVNKSFLAVSQNAGHIACIRNLKHLDLVEVFYDLFNSVANANNPTRPDHESGIQTVASVASAAVPLDTVLTTIAQMKGVTSDESNGLKLLENPKQVSDQIANAVLGIGEMKKAIDAIPMMNMVVDNQLNVALERLAAQENLTSEDTSQLIKLETLDFTTMITKLNGFKSAVETKPLVKLEDASAIFDLAKNVVGIRANLSEILVFLDKLITLSGDPLKLNSVRNALANLRNIQLNFANFQQSYDPAKTSLATLAAFFTKYSAAEVETENSRSNGNGGANGANGLHGASGASKGKEKGDWLFENRGYLIGIAVAIVLGFVGLLLYISWQKWTMARYGKKNSDMQAAQDAGLGEIRAIGVEESKEEKIADRKVCQVGGVPVDTKVLSLENIIETLDAYNCLIVASPPVDNIAAFVNSQKKCLTIYGERIGVTLSPDTKYAIYCKILHNNLEGAADQDRAIEDLDFVNKYVDYTRHNSFVASTTRVLVAGYDEGFIHANFVRLKNGLILIAMQGPIGSVNEKPGKKDTCERTWHMFRQQNATTIAMLCQFQEDECTETAEVCSRFPGKEGRHTSYGNVTVTCLSVEMVPPPAAKVRDWKAAKKEGPCPSDIIIRILHAVYLEADGSRKARAYRHIQYVGWPDMKQPTYMESFQKMLGMVDHCVQPVVVHCSAGIGRTGVFCYVLLATQKLAEEKCSLYGVLLNLRQKRTATVYKPVQLAYCIEATVRYALKGRKLGEKDQKTLDELVELYTRLERGEVPQELDANIQRPKGMKKDVAAV